MKKWNELKKSHNIKSKFIRKDRNIDIGFFNKNVILSLFLVKNVRADSTN